MTVGEAKGLVAKLTAAYPMARVSAATVGLWLAQLRPIEFDLGAEAVENVIHGVAFFPSIAEFDQALVVVREQRGREIREAKRQEALEAEASLPPLAPEVVKEMRRFTAKLAGTDTPGLTEIEPGICDDCKKDSERLFRYVGLALCSKCGALRAGAAGNLYRSNVDLARRWVESEGHKRTDAQVSARLKEMLPGEAYNDPRIVLEDLAADLRDEAAA